MRPLTLDRPGPATARIGLILLIAFMLVLGQLPLAQAGDVEPTEPPATEGAGEGDQEPTVIEDPESAFEEGAGTEGEGAVDQPSDDTVTATEAPQDTVPADEPTQNDTTTVEQDTETGDTTATVQRASKQTDSETKLEATATSAPTAGDFSINWLASHPATYSHVTGGGVYGSGGRDTTVESLNAGDFQCGDLVSYLAAITVDDSTATDAATLQFTTSFATLTSSETGIGHEEIVRAVINTGDPGMDGDAAVTGLVRGTSGGDLTGTVTVDDLEAGERIIVRIDVRLGCQTGGKNVGTIHASLGDIWVVAPTRERVTGGAQTIPFKQDGVARDLVVTKDVVGSAPSGAGYTVTVSCLKGFSTTLNFSGSGSQVAGQIPEGDTCTVTETVNGGADITTVRVNSGATQTSRTATITIGASNTVTFTNTFLAPTVEITKSAAPTTVTPGGTVTYTITATNTSTSATSARGVVITDDLDNDLADVAAQVSVAGATPQDCTVGSGNTVECSVGTLAIGEAAVVTVTARATVASCGDVLNRARVTGSNFSGVNSPQVTVTVQCAPDISLVKSASSTSVVPGEEIIYTLTATNPSTATAAATNVVITDDLDNSLSGVSATVSVAGRTPQSCTIGTGNSVSCRVGTLGIGESAVATIKATAEPASCPSVNNRGSVSGDNFSTVRSNQVTVTVTCTPGLTITKSASKATVVPGEAFEYELTVSSPSSATATSNNVVVTDNLHDGLQVSRPTFRVRGGGPQDCDAVGSGNTVRCAVGDLAPGESAVITIAVTATPASCGPLVNVATATADNITNGVGSNPVTVTVVCTPAPALTKSASAGTVAAGDPITYTITATNAAPLATATAEDVEITDDLDDNLTGVTASVTTNAGTQPCTVDPGNVISCDAGDLGIDETATVTVTATTTQAACGVVTNTAAADGTNFATVTSNTVNVTVVCPPVMGIVKSASTGTVDIGDDFTYTITVTNSAGPTGSAGEDVVVTDDLDDDLAGVAATYRLGAGPAHACDATGTGNTVRCDIGDLTMGASADIVITATATVDACGSVRNVSSASGTNFTTVVSDEVNVLIPCPALIPSISLVKTGIAPQRAEGDPIAYTYLITNTGQTTLTDITLVDDVLGDVTVPKTSLAPGEDMTATATHVITRADVVREEVVNVATVTGTTPTGGSVTATDDEVIPIPGAPDISLEKTPNVDFAEVGDTVTYEYVITNTGTTELTDITLVDDKIGTIVSVDDALTLAAGESTTVTAEYELTEDDLAEGDEVVNVAVATGLPPTGPPVRDTDRAKVGIIQVLDTGTLRVVKVVAGDVPADAEFAFSVDCGDFSVGRDDAFTLGAGGGTHEVGVQIPVGQRCRVVETDTAGADRTTVAVGTAAAQAATSTVVTIREGVTSVTFANTFGRPLPPPELPETGISATLQLMIGLAVMAVGAALVRRFTPDAELPRRRRRRA